MIYMLDTDICIYTIKRKPASVLHRLEKLTPDQVVMSAITFAELIYGARKSQNVQANIQRLNELSEIIAILPFGTEAALIYGDIRSDLEKRGTPIGGNDLIIAAHALSLDLVLVTNNTKEFNRIKKLKIENWAED